MDYSRRDVSKLAMLGAAAGAVGVAAGARAAEAIGASGQAAPLFWAPLDHIVRVVPDLDKAIEEIADLTGVKAVSGGRAPGRDRPHNALVALGGGSYLELISPTRAGMTEGPWLEAIQDGKSHIVTFALRVTDRFAALRKAVAAHGYGTDTPRAMGRDTPAGPKLRWEILNVQKTPHDGAVPFFIDWLGSLPHPSQSSPQGATLERLEVTHPDAGGLAKIYAAIGADVPVLRSDAHRINVTLSTPKGPVFLS